MSDDNWTPGTQLELYKLQLDVKEWSHYNFGDQPAWCPLLGAVEELGELCHTFLKKEQGIRVPMENIQGLMEDAVGDVIIYLADFCSRVDIDMQLALELTWLKVRKRNWKAFPMNGVDK